MFGKNKNKNKKNIFLPLFCLIFAGAFLVACGAGDMVFSNIDAVPAAAPAAESWVGFDMAETMPEEQATATAWAADDTANYSTATSPTNATNATNIIETRMIIHTADISLEVTNFDETIPQVEQIIESYGGFVENSSRGTVVRPETPVWQANFTLRVPVEHFESANNSLLALGETTHFTTFSEDVTDQFRDLATRLRIQQEEERRLLAIIATTEDTTELITLYSRLFQVQLDMERQRIRMTEIDHLASFSTISLFLTEPWEMPAAVTFGNRIGSAFGGSWNLTLTLTLGLVTLLFAVILPLLIVSSPVAAIVIFIRKRDKKLAEKNIPPPPPPPPPPTLPPAYKYVS
ncbi:MAG: DUF4349 domain-containing protein [Defluviitaleaceae bacterium]|nr:DUF4349 domain-containing protein [Defluviitaleaceae bacterium]